jgi:hypothetical protein
MTNNPPPPAHPPEGSQPRLQCSATAYPARQCELDMGHGVIHQFPPPPTPPPGPGQDVEAQARPVEALAKLLQEAGAELVISLTGSEWREVLRAAQAEAERRLADAEMCDGCGRVPPVPDDGKCGCHGEGRSGMLHHVRIVLDKAQDALMAAERRAQAAEAVALGGKLCISQQHADLERRAQEAEHGIARWEVYAQGLEAQVRSAREALRMLMSNAMAILRETGGHRGLAHTSRVSMELAIDFARSALSSSPVSSPERKE